MPRLSLLRSLYASVLLSILMLAVAADPPAIEAPGSRDRNFTIKGNGLTIQPGAEVNSLTFSGGVDIAGSGFALSADKVEVRIDAGEGVTIEGLKLPKMPAGEEDVDEDAGDVAARIAREIELPQARFSRSGIDHVAASGGVTISTQGMLMSTPRILSTDGGRSWIAEGRSTISRTGPGKGESYRLEADILVYDTETQHASARGNIVATIKRSSEAPITLAAQQIELDVGSGRISVSEGIHASFGELSLSGAGLSGDLTKRTLESKGELSATYGSTTLTGGRLSADLDARTLTASGSPQLKDSELDLTLEAKSLSVNMDTQLLTAEGGVSLKDESRDVDITAGKVEADLQSRKLIASGSPTVRYRGSTFTGEKITVSQVDGKTVVEVEGRQEARLKVDELQAAPDAAGN